jgi:hypothetical protein|tara:strand:+ start:2177 stop:2650 length:474 start_codon:yes stop_codon:yes gene_type:complete
LCTSTLVSPRFSVVISPLSASYRLRKRSTLASARARHAFAFRPARFFFIVTLCTRASLSAFTTPTDALATITAAVTNAYRARDPSDARQSAISSAHFLDTCRFDESDLDSSSIRRRRRSSATLERARTVTERFARARGRRAGSRDMSTRVVAVFDLE